MWERIHAQSIREAFSVMSVVFVGNRRVCKIRIIARNLGNVHPRMNDDMLETLCLLGAATSSDPVLWHVPARNLHQLHPTTHIDIFIVPNEREMAHPNEQLGKKAVGNDIPSTRHVVGNECLVLNKRKRNIVLPGDLVHVVFLVAITQSHIQSRLFHFGKSIDELLQLGIVYNTVRIRLQNILNGKTEIMNIVQRE